MTIALQHGSWELAKRIQEDMVRTFSSPQLTAKASSSQYFHRYLHLSNGNESNKVLHLSQTSYTNHFHLHQETTKGCPELPQQPPN